MPRVLACFCQPADPSFAAWEHLSAESTIRSLSEKARAEDVEVKRMRNPPLEEFKMAIEEFKPTLLYMAGPPMVEIDSKTGAVNSFTFRGGEPVDVLEICLQGKGVQALFMDAKCDMSKARMLQSSATVAHVIAWVGSIPASISSQFSHSFFTAAISYAASPLECYIFSSYIVKAYFTAPETQRDQNKAYMQAQVPQLLSAETPTLPDNSSVSPISHIPGIDPSQGVETSPGWADVRLLAPRAELRLLLCGGPDLIDSTRLTFLGEALRSLLVLELRSAKLLSCTPGVKVPANLPKGCTAVRCEVQTVSGRRATVILGGHPDLVKKPEVDEYHKGVLTMGIAAVGGSAVEGVSAEEAARMRMLSTGELSRTSASDAAARAASEKEPLPDQSGSMCEQAC